MFSQVVKAHLVIKIFLRKVQKYMRIWKIRNHLFLIKEKCLSCTQLDKY